MYGETGALMRSELATLLHIHRTQRRLGSESLNATALEERGVQIRQYRQSILTWSAEAVRAAKPLVFSVSTPVPANPFRATTDLGPVHEFARALDHTRQHSTAPLPSLDQLTTSSGNELVEHWRHAARAAALAEHDTNGAQLASRLTAAQANALVSDVAAITQALIVLDQRYTNTPGWERLAQPQRLGWAALATAIDVALERPDYTVDQTGWRPRATAIRGPAKPGILGVLQAEHNLLVRLQTTPNALSLRLVVDSQRQLSHGLAELAGPVDEVLAQGWRERTATYVRLQSQLRNLGSRLGGGGTAVAEASNAVARLRALPRETVVEPRVLGAFQTLFSRIDTRLADVVTNGIADQTLLHHVTTATLDGEAQGLVHRLREHFEPIPQPVCREIHTTIRGHLRPRQPDAAPPDAGHSRAQLHTALLPRPTQGGRDVRSL